MADGMIAADSELNDAYQHILLAQAIAKALLDSTFKKPAFEPGDDLDESEKHIGLPDGSFLVIAYPSTQALIRTIFLEIESAKWAIYRAALDAADHKWVAESGDVKVTERTP